MNGFSLSDKVPAMDGFRIFMANEPIELSAPSVSNIEDDQLSICSVEGIFQK